MAPPRVLSALLLVFPLGCGAQVEVHERSNAEESAGVGTGGASASTGTAAGCHDGDGDGALAAVCGGIDCNDDDARVHPWANDSNSVPGAWRNEVALPLLSSGDTRDEVAIALEPGGAAHLLVNLPGAVLHATNRTGRWTVESLGDGGGGLSAIAYHRGLIHACFRGGDGHMRYAHRTTNSEVVGEIIDTNAATACAMALDGDGRPHVTFAGVSGLRHGWRNGAWTVETLAGDSGHRMSLVVDDHNEIHVSFGLITQGTDEVRYGTTRGGWHSEIVSDAGNFPTAIALDVLGGPHVMLAPPGGLLAGARADEGWSFEDTALEDDVFAIDLALDRAGYRHVVVQTGNAYYGSRTSGAWEFQLVGAGSSSGGGASLELDSGGSAHVSYGGFTFSGGTEGYYATNRDISPDGVDANCDGVDGIDGDGDGHASLHSGGDDCDDAQPSIIMCP